MTYEQLLNEVGGFGKFQKTSLLVYGLAMVPVGLQILLGIFTLAVPDFRCAIPGFSNDTYTIQGPSHSLLLNATIPWEDDKERYSQCHRYASGSAPGPDPASSVGTRPVEACDSWVFSTDIFQSTLVTQLSLVCDRVHIITVANSMAMAGLMAGNFIAGIVGDWMGRRWTSLLILALLMAGGYLMATVNSVPMLYMFRLLENGLASALNTVLYTWILELVTPERRVRTGLVPSFGWVLALFALCGLAYFLRHWRYLQLACASTAPLPLVALWFIPESPRWLVCKGRNSEALQILKRIAAVNGRELSEEHFHQVATEGASTSSDGHQSERFHQVATEDAPTSSDGHQSEYKPETLLTLLRSKFMTFRLVVLALNWIACTMVYYGITLNLGSIIEGDLHLNFFIMSVLELAALTFLFFVMDAISRKLIYSTITLLVGMACLATVVPLVVAPELTWINTILANIGKFGVTSTFAIIYLFTAELMPTSVRTTGVGFCAFAGRIGGIVSPYIADLGRFVDGRVGQALPLIIFGGLTIAAGLLSLTLPDTSNKVLPQTLEEVKTMRRREKAATKLTKERPDTTTNTLLA